MNLATLNGLHHDLRATAPPEWQVGPMQEGAGGAQFDLQVADLRLTVGEAVSEDPQRLLVVLELGAVPPGQERRAWQALMWANHEAPEAASTRFACRPQDDMPVLIWRLQGGPMLAAALRQQLQTWTGTLAQWRTLMAGEDHEAEDARRAEVAGGVR